MVSATDRRARALVAVAFAVVVLMCASAPALAHDAIASSTPRAGSVIDRPISEVTIEFPDEITDDVELTLLDPDEHPLASTTTKVSPTTVRIDFEPLARQGTYIVQYLAQIVSDDDLTTGAISFDYGSAGSGMGAGPWVFVAAASVVILSIGIGLSVRGHRRAAADETA